jgi:AraC family transcriptional activator of pyochelin receptor
MREVREHAITVSPELTVLIGRPSAYETPDRAIAFAFTLGTIHDSSTAAIVGVDRRRALVDHDAPGLRVVLLVDTAVLDRMGNALPAADAWHSFHMPSELRAIALALRDCETLGEAGALYQAAKAVELLCDTLRLRDAALLQPLASNRALSRAHSLRIMAARRVVDERWNEKLSLEQIAALCGLNRESLTRGFREMFDCSVAEAIAERRLSEASRMLLTTDLPVSSIGYENGYGNNASFARAFGRRFGLSPSHYRAQKLAA